MSWWDAAQHTCQSTDHLSWCAPSWSMALLQERDLRREYHSWIRPQKLARCTARTIPRHLIRIPTEAVSGWHSLKSDSLSFRSLPSPQTSILGILSPQTFPLIWFIPFVRQCSPKLASSLLPSSQRSRSPTLCCATPRRVVCALPAISPDSLDCEIPVDVDILNFALTLEHIENAFYTQGLSRFKQEDFVDAGFPNWSYGRLKQIAAHEAAHVEFLEGILGDKATKPCTYKLFVIMVFGRRWLTAFAVSPALIMTPSPLSLLVMPLRLLASVSLPLTALVSHVIFYTRGFVVYWCIEILQQQGTLSFYAQFRGDDSGTKGKSASCCNNTLHRVPPLCLARLRRQTRERMERSI